MQQQAASNLKLLKSFVTRALYLLAMYSGARAAFNQARSFFLPKPRASILDGETLQLDEFNQAKVCVNARTPPKAIGPGRNAGMISVYLVNPGISHFFYALLRLTSHFGCGHIEIAFYEENGDICFFAIRNILRSNIDRIGCDDIFRNLKLSRDNDEIVILREIIYKFGKRHINTCFATPEACVALAVAESLLSPKKRDRSIQALNHRYRRMSKQIATHNK